MNMRMDLGSLEELARIILEWRHRRWYRQGYTHLPARKDFEFFRRSKLDAEEIVEKDNHPAPLPERDDWFNEEDGARVTPIMGGRCE